METLFSSDSIFYYLSHGAIYFTCLIVILIFFIYDFNEKPSDNFNRIMKLVNFGKEQGNSQGNLYNDDSTIENKTINEPEENKKNENSSLVYNTDKSNSDLTNVIFTLLALFVFILE